MGRVLIDGGTGGIGLATAQTLRVRGCPLHLAARDPDRVRQAAVPALRAGAAIVLFSTVTVVQGFAAHACVALAKVEGAVEGLALTLAAELAPQVRVDVVGPSLTRTPLSAAITGNETLAQGIAAMHAIRRLGRPEDIGALAAFLVPAEAGWITGQVIGVDGGRSTLRTKG